MKHSILIIFAFLAAVSTAQVNFQPGYIIQNNGDTLKGLIDYRQWARNPEKISFKKDVASDIIEYLPLSIREFAVAGEIFKSAVVELETGSNNINALRTFAEPQLRIDTVFIQALYIGRKSLFYLCDIVGKEHFYFRNEDSYELLIYKKYLKQMNDDKSNADKNASQVVQNMKYKGQLINYLNDCSSIFSAISSTAYEKKDLQKLFDTYASCTQSDWSYKIKNEQRKIQHTLFSGLTLTSLNTSSTVYDHINKPEFEPSLNIHAGYRLSLISPRNYGKWAACGELMYSSYLSKGIYRDYKNENDYTIIETRIGATYFKLNVMIMNRYPVGKSIVTGSLGYSTGFLVASENNYTETFKLYTTERVKSDPAITNEKSLEQGIFLGIGAKHKAFSGEFRYERGNGLSQSTVIHSATNRFYLILGYTL